MKKTPIPDVGHRIRALREQRAFSLRALAERCDLSINAISRIERNETSPTISSLHQLAVALGVPIVDFFTVSNEQKTVFLKRSDRSTIGKNGMSIEGLGFGLRNQQLEPLLVTLEPAQQHQHEHVSHPGEEFVYCLDGQVSYEVGEQTYSMESGDSLIFEATQPHLFYNPGSTPAQILLVFQAFEGGHIARRHHID
jgi:transcriptional regulator with XRE-family HTH domain